MLLFQPQWEPLSPDIHDLRETAVAGLRYQYVRNLGSDRFDGLVGKLLETGPEARDLWDRYVIGFPRRRYAFRMRDRPGPHRRGQLPDPPVHPAHRPDADPAPSGPGLALDVTPPRRSPLRPATAAPDGILIPGGQLP